MNEPTASSATGHLDGVKDDVLGPQPAETPAFSKGERSPDPCLISSKLAYTIPEAGQLLGLCRASIYKLIADGQLTTVNLSERAPRILRSELLGFLQRKAAAAQARQDAVRATLRPRSVRWS